MFDKKFDKSLSHFFSKIRGLTIKRRGFFVLFEPTPAFPPVVSSAPLFSQSALAETSPSSPLNLAAAREPSYNTVNTKHSTGADLWKRSSLSCFSARFIMYRRLFKQIRALDRSNLQTCPGALSLILHPASSPSTVISYSIVEKCCLWWFWFYCNIFFFYFPSCVFTQENYLAVLATGECL